MRAMKLYTNGLTTVIQMPKREQLFKSMQEAVGCSIVDIQNAITLGDQYCLVFDEEFLLNNKPVINPIGSYLFGLKEHGQPLCGTVLIMKNKMSDDGLETVGLDEQDFDYIHNFIRENFSDMLRTVTDFLESIRK